VNVANTVTGRPLRRLVVARSRLAGPHFPHASPNSTHTCRQRLAVPRGCDEVGSHATSASHRHYPQQSPGAPHAKRNMPSGVYASAERADAGALAELLEAELELLPDALAFLEQVVLLLFPFEPLLD